jgi:predicted GNAT superfamily acetyltransferase
VFMELQMPSAGEVYSTHDAIVVFNQLATKIVMDYVPNYLYFGWLDEMTATIGAKIPGAAIKEKPDARITPPLNTAIYYDTSDYKILPTGALLRTSCNKITHAFCAFKMAQDQHGVRRDHRYVFEGHDKAAIQKAPASDEAVRIVKTLLSRSDIDHPGTFLSRSYGIAANELSPSILLDDYRYTFFVWLDGRDALRCSVDRATVANLRPRGCAHERRSFAEVEIAIYPRISPEVARDDRVVAAITALTASLCNEFGTRTTTEIKYQRAARALSIPIV